MRRHHSALLSILFLIPTGCLTDDASSQQNESEFAPFSDDVCGNGDQDDSKTEGGQLGVTGASIDLGSRVVTFESWIAKTDSPGDYAGFELSVSAGDEISFLVKAGGETHRAAGLSWMHPNGDGGSEVPGISNIDFCDDGEGGDGDGDGDDGDDDGGDCIPDADTGECDSDDGGGDGGDGGDGDCIPDADTGECDSGDGSGDGGGDGDDGGDCVPDADTGECEGDGSGDNGGVD